MKYWGYTQNDWDRSIGWGPLPDKYKRRPIMDVDKLRHELEIDEGRVDEVYHDHLGFPTFGIGHLITEFDAEDGLPVGTAVSSRRVEAVFEEDVELVCDDCIHLFPDFFELPEAAQLVIANMMFNMGRTRLSKFKGMKSGVSRRDWNDAADEMVDSIWYRQVTNRANRLVERMRNV